MLLVTLQALFFFLPSYVANATPILLAKYNVWKSLNVPIDFGRKLGKEDIFGQTKTYRGVVGGVMSAFGVVSLQALFYYFFEAGHFLYLFPYTFPSILLLGFLLGLGEGLGDLIKSFFKRRWHIKSSQPLFFFDQLSFLGALFLSFLFFVPPLDHIVVLLVVSPFLPIVANIVAYKCGWKKVWW